MDNTIIMTNKVLEAIEKYEMINCKEGVVVGISGGADSVCLLHILNRISKNYKMKLYAAHVNHMLRGSDSDEDAKYVKKVCESLGVELYIKSIDIKAISKEEGISLEAAGRRERYNFFFEVLKLTGASKIAVAHNMNDQAETVLMHFIRGAGLEGLLGIRSKRKDGIIRPLIEIERADIEKYCIANDLNPRLDKSNLETIFTRNKIRLELIPQIIKDYNPNLIKALSNMATNNRNDNDYIDSEINKIGDEIFIYGEDAISLSIDWILKQHLSIQNRIIRKAIERLLGSKSDIESKHINEIIKIINKGNTGLKLDLPREIMAEIVYDKVYIKKKKKLDISYEYPLVLNQKIYISELNSYFQATKISVNELKNVKLNSNTAVFDYEIIEAEAGARVELRANEQVELRAGGDLGVGVEVGTEGNILIRSRLPGDTITPLGMTGTKKIKDLFIDLKIPRNERDKIPLLAFNNQILWVVGHRINNRFKFTDNTKEVLIVKYSGEG